MHRAKLPTELKKVNACSCGLRKKIETRIKELDNSEYPTDIYIKEELEWLLLEDD